MTEEVVYGPAGHIAVAAIRLDEAVNEHQMEVPELQVGDQSFHYCFGSIQPGDNAANFEGVIVDIADEGRAQEATNVSIHFWAELASRHATVGATFDVWYGSIVGSGTITEVPPTEDAGKRVAINLTSRERDLLRAGILDWGGPAHCTDDLAQEMGFKNVADLFNQGYRLRETLRFNEPLTVADWRRSLVAAETCFMSPLGSTIDWETTTGFSRDDAKLFIQLHQKLAGSLGQT